MIANFSITLGSTGGISIIGVIIALLFIGFIAFFFIRNKILLSKGDKRGLETHSMFAVRQEPVNYDNSPEVNNRISQLFNNCNFNIQAVTEKDYYDSKCVMPPTLTNTDVAATSKSKFLNDLANSSFFKKFAELARMNINNTFQAQTRKGNWFNYGDVIAYHINPDERPENFSYMITLNGAFITIPKQYSIEGSLYLNSLKSSRYGSFMRTGDMIDTDTENIEFNKIVNAYTNSPETEFYMLTPHVMEKLMSVHNASGGIMGGIHPYGIYLAIPGFRLANNVDAGSKILEELVDAFSK